MESYILLLLITTTILTIISYKLFWNTSKDEFLEKEAERYFEKDCEIDKDWTSKGRIYGKGMSFHKDKEGNLIIINQAKLIGIGLL